MSLILSQRLSWPVAAVWSSADDSAGPRLLVSDVARNDDPHTLFTVSLTGEVSSLGANFAGVELFFPLYLRSTQQAIFIDDKPLGSILHFSPKLDTAETFITYRGTKVPGNGIISDILDWAPYDDAVLALAAISYENEPFALFRVVLLPTSGTPTLFEWAGGSDDFEKPHFLHNSNYLASLTGKGGFLLDYSKQPDLLRLTPGASQPIRSLQDLPASLTKRLKLEVDEPWRRERAYSRFTRGSGRRQAFLYYKLQEQTSVTTSIFSWKERLYLLTKDARSERGITRWTLAEIDPTTGLKRTSFTLPTTAPHILVVPANLPGSKWAVIELSTVGLIGPLEEPSVTFSSTNVVLIEPDAVENPPANWVSAQQPYTCPSPRPLSQQR